MFKRAVAFHTHLFVLAQSGETLVACIERDVIARGIFTSVQDFARKLMRYIHAYSAAPKPFAWKYSHASRRVRTKELSVREDDHRWPRRHRSVSALLTHTGPSLDTWHRSEHRDRDARCADKVPSGRTASDGGRSRIRRLGQPTISHHGQKSR
ncbi:MAG: hypothetical protein JO108_17410 [Acidobacteriaceae bacterium]|nr:hypothetical protein [Acidobacteriaceae bacterium]